MKKINDKLLSIDLENTPKSNSNLSLSKLKRSQTSTCLTVSSNSNLNKDILHSEEIRRKQNFEERIIPSFNFLPSNQKIDEVDEVEYQNSPFIAHKIESGIRPKLIKTQESDNLISRKPKLKKINSFVESYRKKDNPFEAKTHHKSVKKHPKKLNLSKRKLLLGLRKKTMKFKAFSRTLKGFNPIHDKPNQDKSLIHEFQIDKEKIKCYVVADGHGKKYRF